MSDRKSIVRRGANLPAATNDKALTKSVFDARLQALRRDTGIVEERVLRFRCGATAEGFTVHMRRPNEGGKFVVAEIVKIEPVAATGGLISGTTNQDVSKPQSYDVGEFDTSGIKCPWCGIGPGFVYCDHCTYFVCRARVKEHTVGRFFRCHDGCGAAFEHEPLKRLTAEGGGGLLRLGPRKAKALPGRTNKALPGKSVPRLKDGRI